MIFITYILALIITIKITNSKNNDNSQDSLRFERKDSIIILALAFLAMGLQWIVNSFFSNIFWIAVISSFVGFFFIFTILNENRAKIIKNKQEQIQRIYLALKDIFGKIDEDDIDYEDLPFEYKMDKQTKIVNYVKVDTSRDDVRSNEDALTYAQFTINKHFPEFQWINEVQEQERIVEFKGLPKPPKIAKWPGTDYRPAGWIPLGVSGKAELAWNMANPKDLGHSSYVSKFPLGDAAENADGKDKSKGYQLPNGLWVAPTENIPSAPQNMVSGGTGGGKAISVNQYVVIKDN